jgi:hypothetical protein
MTAHIDEGFDFLGFRIQRQTKRGRTGRSSTSGRRSRRWPPSRRR